MTRWVGEMQPHAIRVGISPAELRAMTPRELQWRVSAVWVERNRHLEIAAQLACWVMAPFTKRPLKIKDLIGRPTKRKKKPEDQD